MARHFVNRSHLHILVVMLTFHRLQQRVDASPSLRGNNDSTIKKAINFKFPVTIERDTLNRTGRIVNRQEDKRGWEAIELSRRKRDDSITVNWKQRESDRGATHWATLNQNDNEAASKRGWNLFTLNKKRGWDGIDFPWGKRSKKENFPKQKWNGVNIAFRKLSNTNKDSQQERGIADNIMTQASSAVSEESQHQTHDSESDDVSRKRGWDGVDFLFKSHKDPNMRGWGGGDFTTGKRSADREDTKTGWDSAKYSPVNHSDDKESNKRGWDGIDFTFGKRTNNIKSHIKGSNSDDFSTEKRSNENESHKRGWGGVDVTFGKRSNDYESNKRGWDGVDFPFGRRSDSPYPKQDWAGMDLVLGVGLDTNRVQREKRGWEGLNFHYRVVNGYGPSQSSDYPKRGWEGVDTCACCRSNRWVLCCLTCNRNDSKPKQRLTTKSYKDMFYVRDTVCKCCYATKVKDCCDLCDVMS
ncbi:hypothetical protein KP79_PYT05527 [Mizuhopecten yessoensis]|uniref:GWamide n=1 Tax=Mizuhopecten yessoensis TaxID=6573 RepID=A0A210QW58_MIZYE|nr:GWamide [Mizuhopecten yessoensis]OWF52997.1 hypothetical protein KP79_PYT05527 [Mizuhopecten yessoensis]